jgi:predicted TIM-barrel fold metal-dependent hydrolase
VINAFAAIDCDVHPAVPAMRELLPYLDEYWRESVVERGIPSLETNAYPPRAPLSARPQWRGKTGQPEATIERLSEEVFGRLKAERAICNCLYGVELLFSEDLAAAFARALNDWTVKECLDSDPRLAASIVVPTQNIELAVDEIERCAKDRRFVQILLYAMQESPLGRRHWWPLYAAAERHRLPIGIHPGSTYRHSLTSLGWPTYYAEDYASYAQAFQSQLGSLIAEGVFAKFPDLKVVLIESGVTWLPGFLWRFAKFWRGVRAEVPWVDRPPQEIVREHVRLTIQPFDAPDEPETVERLIDHLGGDDILLYASDFPHWQFDGEEALPPGLPDALRRKVLIDNPLATYARLKEDVR